MADPTTKDSRTIRAGEDRTGPRAFRRMSRHVNFDLAHKLLEDVGAISRWSSERFADGAT